MKLGLFTEPRGNMLELREALRSSRFDAETAPAREPGLRARLDRLRDKGVAISEQLEDDILNSSRRRAALNQVDFSRRGTALDHIERVADAGRLADNTQSGRLASQLLKLAGSVRAERGWGMSYARANQAVFTAHHAGEFCRLIADLAVDRRTELASGQPVRWSPAAFPIDPGRHLEFLWGGLNHLLVQDEVPEDATLAQATPVASQAQMANLMTRLTGHPYVNAEVNGTRALRQIIDEYGPPLAKYGSHAGSLAKFDEERRPLSLETGDTRPQPMSHPLDFVVIPHEALRDRESLKAVRYVRGSANYIHDLVEPLKAPPAPKTRGAQEMADALRARGIDVQSVVNSLASDPARLAALNQRDFVGRATTFDHIMRIAEAGHLRDNSDANLLATDLFLSAGTNRAIRIPNDVRCYSRTMFAIYLKHHPGELARLVGDLTVNGQTTLASGKVVRWEPRRLPLNGGPSNGADTLFGYLLHSLKARRLPAEVVPSNAEGEYAYQGEMANIHSRLTGRTFINVSGRAALRHLPEVIRQTGPLLAEYQQHGGSVAAVEDGTPMSLETGQARLTARNNLGYVVFPEDEARARGLEILRPDEPERGYARD